MSPLISSHCLFRLQTYEHNYFSEVLRTPLVEVRSMISSIINDSLICTLCVGYEFGNFANAA